MEQRNPSPFEIARKGPRLSTRAAIYLDVQRHYIIESLRRMLGLDPGTPVPGEQAAAFCVVPSTVTDLDVGAWVAWCIVGLSLFSRGLPALAIAHEATALVVLTHTMLRVGGNLSKASKLTGTCRKIFRDNLVRLDLYDWAVALRGVMKERALPDHHPLVLDVIRSAQPQGVDNV